MHAKDCSFMVDAAAMFFDYVRIEGWFHCASDTLAEVRLIGNTVSGVDGVVGLPHAGVEQSLGPNLGFRLQAILEESQRTKDLRLIFKTVNGKTVNGTVLGLCFERKKMFEGPYLLDEFVEMVGKMEIA
jgi:hypothetical protein